MVRKRRFFRKNEELVVLKLRFSTRKTSFFPEKNAVFSSVDFFFVILKVSFTLKSLRNSEKFTQAHSFHISILLLRMRGDMITGLVNSVM